MAFTAGISRPKTNNFSGNQQKKFDRLLTVLNYDTSKATLYGEDNDGIKYEVIVDPELVIKIDKNTYLFKLDTSYDTLLYKKENHFYFVSANFSLKNDYQNIIEFYK